MKLGGKISSIIESLIEVLEYKGFRISRAKQNIPNANLAKFLRINDPSRE